VSPEQRQYLFVQSAIGSAVVNALINGAIGWAATRSLVEFPAWKTPGVAGDLVATAFGVAFGTCLGSALQARLDVRRGKISPPTSLSPALARLMSLMPARLVVRALVVGIASVVLFAPAALVALAASGAQALAPGTFVSVKALFSAIEGAAVTPFLVLAALQDRLDARPSS